MSSRSKKSVEHLFSVELKSKEYIKRVAMSNDAEEKVLIEGFLGELEELSFIEGVMLEMKGVNGILRLDLSEEKFRKLLSKGGSRSHSKGEKRIEILSNEQEESQLHEHESGE